MKKFTIISNWKMNFPDDIDNIIDISNKYAGNNLEISLAVPFTEFHYISSLINNKNLSISAQNVSSEIEGSYTGEISAKILNKYKIKYCLVGHYERRKYFNESHEQILKKIENLVRNGIIPILCIGEFFECSINEKKKILKEQVKKCTFDGIDEIIIAYEPSWLIGTGKSLDVNEARDIIEYLKESFENYFSNLQFYYGGSINSNNVKEFFNSKLINGIILGKASLSLKEFNNTLKGCK